MDEKKSENLAEVTASAPSLDVTGMLESCLGCKWTLYVLGKVRRGVTRPGEMVRSTPGLSKKVLNERLSKLQRFGILDRTSFPEIPPRVEYSLTDFGKEFLGLLDQIEALDRMRLERDTPESAS